MSYNSPEQQGLRRQKKAALWGMNVEELDERDQRTAQQFAEIGRELKRIGCTGVAVGANQVSYAAPPKDHPLLNQWRGYPIDWIGVAKDNIAKRK